MTSARTRSEYRLLLDGASVAPAGGAPFTLRRVEPGDRDVLSMVLLDAYRGSVDDEGEGPEEASEAIDDYFSMMAWPHGRVLELEDTIGAFAFVVVVGDRHYIDPVATARAAQRRGLGTAVVRAVLASLRAAGVAEVGATITDGNVPSERLFASLGFARIGPWPAQVRS